jgi:hypothetical protein
MQNPHCKFPRAMPLIWTKTLKHQPQLATSSPHTTISWSNPPFLVENAKFKNQVVFGGIEVLNRHILKANHKKSLDCSIRYK